jgi:hypothetical protein
VGVEVSGMMVSPPAAPGPGEEAGVAVAVPLASEVAVGEEAGVSLDAGVGVAVGASSS